MAAVDIELLRKIPLFEKMTETELADLGKLLRSRSLDANQTLFWMGDPGDDFYIIQSGQIQVVHVDDDGKEKHVAVLQAGNFFGELALLDGGPRTATTRTLAPSILLCLGRKDLEQYLVTHGEAAWHILGVLGHRQREMLEQLRGIKNVNQVLQQKISNWHRASDAVAQTMTTPYFMIAQAAIIIFWVILAHHQGEHAIDPYPFNLLSLIVSVEALFLSAFLLVSQGRQSERDRVRADLDYQVNLKAHMEVMQLHQKIDRIEETVKGVKPIPQADPNPRPLTERF